MTFNQEVKRELCRIEPRRLCCAWAQLYGMALFSRSFLQGGPVFVTEGQRVAEQFAQLAAGLTGAFVSIHTDVRRKAGERYSVVIEDKNQQELAAERLGLKMPSLNPLLLEKDCCASAFFRGLFLVYGSVTNPQREYHLELAAPGDYLAEEVLLFGKGRGTQWKAAKRKGNALLYLKESEQIEEFLTTIGATKATLKLMDIKIVKDMRNKVNRATNCETANLDKTVGASQSQIADILYIQDHGGLSLLEEDLEELAQLRLDNPECSLRELAELLHPPISRSGVNHRLKRIQQFAEKLREESQGRDRR